MTPREKQVWLQRLACLQSLSLEAIADEVNQSRLKAYLCVLSAPTEAQRKKMRALIRRYEAGELVTLPTDLRADGGRMCKALIALHRLLRGFPSGVYRHDQIAAEAGFSSGTCKRAVRDLAEAGLIIADRKRARPRRDGGQGANSYRVVWSTVINLALAQGLQHALPLVTEEQGRPPASMIAASARKACPPQVAGEPRDGVTSHCEKAPSHRETAPSHRETAPSHRETIKTSHGEGSATRPHAGASFLPSIHPSSPSAPSENAGHTPSAETAVPSATQKEEKEFLAGEKNGWPAAANRLERYGIYLPRRALEWAQAHAWTAAQVIALLDQCESKIVERKGARIYAWSPGLVYRHLCACPAGAAIAVSPGETYRRAARDRAIELQQQRQAAQSHTDEQTLARTQVPADVREAEFGPVLDALAPPDRDELARHVFADAFSWKCYRRIGHRAIAIRSRLLRELELRAAKPAN
jgi:DNA-binding Lrp family transcriptional regulator